MIYLLSKHPDLTLITASDLKLAFTNSWFVYAKALIHLMPTDSLKSFISTEIFHVAISHGDPKFVLIFVYFYFLKKFIDSSGLSGKSFVHFEGLGHKLIAR